MPNRALPDDPMIRRASTEDVLRLLAIEVACFGADAWGTSLLESAVTDPHQDVLITTSGDAFGVVRVAGDTADLDRLATLPEARRRGVGRDLLAQLTDHAGRRGAARMLLEVAEDNSGALALYVDSGFVEIHRRSKYYPGGIDAIVMQRPLAD